jgi:hypothetical protein
MFDSIRIFCARLVLMTLVVLFAGSAASAEDVSWRVSKSTGDVSVTTSAGQQTALVAGAVLNPGDNIRTGQTGRVLLVRGEETILVAPNSVIGIPTEKKSGLSTTIIQQAGSILLEVEKRNVKHFSVETPYLAAVVKGTQFRVTVNDGDSRVEVLKGQVEVMGLKSGQYALVQPGQAAQVSAQGRGSLSLDGTGTMSPIQQGTPRSALVTGLSMPKESIPAPAVAANAASPPNVRVAAMPTEIQWAPVAPSGSDGWASWFGSSSKSIGSSVKRSTQEDIFVAVGLSGAIGFIVAIAVGTLRRRKSRKMANG